MTQLLCAIPTCRIPGQHRDDCDQADCRGCLPRPTEDGWCCDPCVGHMHQLLGVIADLAPDARAVAAGQVRRGPSAGSGGKPGSRPPLNDGATDALDAITNALTTIARDIAETRGLRGPQSHAGTRTPTDPLAEVCSWLSDQMRWVRHATDDQGQPYAVTFHTEIRDAASRIRSILDGPAARRYLGPCGVFIQVNAATFSDPEPRYIETACEGDVYGRIGATTGRCRTCGTQHPQRDRQKWLSSLTADRAYRASEIADHLRDHEDPHMRIRAHTIRVWADRELIPIHDHDQHGRQLYLLGDVLNHAATMAARRAELDAKRTAREAAGMGA